jgi:hypothetical protein
MADLLSLTSGNVTFIDDALWAFAYDLASRSPWVRVTVSQRCSLLFTTSHVHKHRHYQATFHPLL